MNPTVAAAVQQCIEYLNSIINTPEEFMADEIRSLRVVDTQGFETWKIIAVRGDKTFMYAWYVDGNDIVCDGS